MLIERHTCRQTRLSHQKHVCGAWEERDWSPGDDGGGPRRGRGGGAGGSPAASTLW